MSWLNALTDDLRGVEGKTECPNCWKRGVVEDKDGSHTCEKCGWSDANKKSGGWFS